MPKRGKRYIEAAKKIDRLKKYTFNEAIELAVDTSYVKFDTSVDISVRLGVDPVSYTHLTLPTSDLV